MEERILKKHVLLYVVVLLISVIKGCSPNNESKQVDAAVDGNVQINEKLNQLQRENENLKEALKKHQEESDYLLERIRNMQKEYEDLYTLRNHLDLRAHQIIKAMKEPDTETLKGLVSSDVTIKEDRMITKDKTQLIEYEFSFKNGEIIRQRAFSLHDTQYISIYETIHPENDFTNSIEFTFILENGEWKLRTILTGA